MVISCIRDSCKYLCHGRWAPLVNMIWCRRGLLETCVSLCSSENHTSMNFNVHTDGIDENPEVDWHRTFQGLVFQAVPSRMTIWIWCLDTEDLQWQSLIFRYRSYRYEKLNTNTSHIWYGFDICALMTDNEGNWRWSRHKDPTKSTRIQQEHKDPTTSTRIQQKAQGSNKSTRIQQKAQGSN